MLVIFCPCQIGCPSSCWSICSNLSSNVCCETNSNLSLQKMRKRKWEWTWHEFDILVMKLESLNMWKYDIPTWSLTFRPWKVTGPQKERIVFQPVFFRGELLNFGFMYRYCWWIALLWKFTPPKTNMEPENGPLEKEIPIGNHHFQVPC